MPGTGILELLGTYALLVLMLGVFWNGDDALSDQARKDISEWLLHLKPPLQSSPIGQSVLAIFEKIFGSSQWSLRCFLMSTIVSVMAVTTFSLIQNAVIQNGKEVFRTWIENWKITISFLIYFNPIGDFLSVWVTRLILNKITKYGSVAFYILIGMILLIVLFVVWNLIAYWLLWLFSRFYIENSIPVSLDYILVPLNFYFYMFFDPSVQSSVVAGNTIIFRSMVFTAILTWVWILAAALGTAAIRLLARSGPLLQFMKYLLPISNKPMRSMGVAGFLVIIFFSIFQKLLAIFFKVFG